MTVSPEEMRVHHPSLRPCPHRCLQHHFHRACLIESRAAGNAGCPCCRGALQQGLSPLLRQPADDKFLVSTVAFIEDQVEVAMRQQALAARELRVVARPPTSAPGREINIDIDEAAAGVEGIDTVEDLDAAVGRLGEQNMRHVFVQA